MNTFNFIYGISYMGLVALTFATGVGYYASRTGYVEISTELVDSINNASANIGD